MVGGQRVVLIVDDIDVSRMFVQCIMENEGWATLEAETGAEAIDVAEAELPDLILLDVDMPVMNGFDAFKNLRDNPVTANIPIIMLTAINEDSAEQHDEASMEKKFGLNGPEGFVDKPVDATFLLSTIMGIVG